MLDHENHHIVNYNFEYTEYGWFTALFASRHLLFLVPWYFFIREADSPLTRKWRKGDGHLTFPLEALRPGRSQTVVALGVWCCLRHSHWSPSTGW
jgi:hypothetical protein